MTRLSAAIAGHPAHTAFPAALAATAKEPGAAKAFLTFLTSPEAIKVIKAHGLEPPG